MSISLWLVRRGYLDPTAASASPIDCTEFSTVQYCTWHIIGSMAPVLYSLVKALRMGTGSLYEAIRGVRAAFLQNVAHFDQCPLAVATLLV